MLETNAVAAAMTPGQTEAWEQFFDTRYSALYWQYEADRRSRKLKIFTFLAVLIGGGGIFGFFVNLPFYSNIVALIASGISLYLSVFDLRTAEVEAQLMRSAYSRLGNDYEKLWIEIQTGKIPEEEISDRLLIIADKLSILPEEKSQYDDALRLKVFDILTKSLGLKDV